MFVGVAETKMLVRRGIRPCSICSRSHFVLPLMSLLIKCISIAIFLVYFRLIMTAEVYDMELSLVEGSLIDGTIEGDLNVSTNVEVSSTPIKSRAIRVREVSPKLKRCL